MHARRYSLIPRLYVMDSATASEHIFMLLEVLSRYSVPAFFFISGYGLFYTYALDKPFAYWSFIKKRLTSIGVPYLCYLVAALFCCLWLRLP